MPTESTTSNPLPTFPTNHHSQGVIKCSICGLGNITSGSSTNTTINEGIVVLSDPIERICGRCVNSPDARRRIERYEYTQQVSQGSEGEEGSGEIERRNSGLGLGLGLGLRGVELDERLESTISTDEDSLSTATPNLTASRELNASPTSSSSSTIEREDSILSNSNTSSPKQNGFSRSLPNQNPKPWRTVIPKSTLSANSADHSGHSNPSSYISNTSSHNKVEEEIERPPNPLLDITKSRIPSIGRGALYPGSIFRGTQTSGRSAYEVEIQFVDVNFETSNVSGYLSISHLTDSHPELTTFFDGEIIGNKYGFITGKRFNATEHDDMRHWGRFEQFRRPSTRINMIKPELYFRDNLPDKSNGEFISKQRDFVFLRIKEKFLVPDHRVRDISGASFAGFYYALVDLSPPSAPLEPSTPTSPTTPKTPFGPPAPIIIRRGSNQADVRGNVRPDGSRRRESSSRLRDVPVRGEATIRGYYFHSLNQEPFQELFLTHVPQKSSSTFEFR